MSEDKWKHARSNAKAWVESIKQALADLDTASVEPDRESAHEAIDQMPLSVQVRCGWHAAGSDGPAKNDPEEYEILLTTGGPGLRIWGQLGAHCEPTTAELQMQDWGLPWTRYATEEAPLLAFAHHFYYGD